MSIRDLTVGEFYQFDYHNKLRKVVVLEVHNWNGSVTCWDFTSNGYRTFFVYDRANWQRLSGFTTDNTEYVFRNRENRDIRTAVHKDRLYALAMN